MITTQIPAWLSRPTTIAIVTFVLLITASSSSFAQVKASVISIANAKKLSLGNEVTVEGEVTVPSGAFRSSFSDAGFQIEDKTSGMYVSIKTDLHLTVGQNVRLTGTIAETALKFQIIKTNESSVNVLTEKSRPKPKTIATGNIVEPVIGKLIKITAKVTKPVDEVAPYGFRLPVDDGSGEIIAYVSTSTGILPEQFEVGQKVELIGIAGQFNGHYQIYPRSPADIKLLGKNSATK